VDGTKSKKGTPRRIFSAPSTVAPRSHCSTSSGVISMTGIAFSWMGSTKAYKQRHRIENVFCRLKDFRRIATRYDKLARNFLASSASSLLSYGGFYESGP
jgi:transposase